MVLPMFLLYSGYGKRRSFESRENSLYKVQTILFSAAHRNGFFFFDKKSVEGGLLQFQLF